MSSEERTISGWVDRISLSLSFGGWARRPEEPYREIAITVRRGTITLGQSSLPSTQDRGSSNFEVQIQGRLAVAASQALRSGELQVFADDVPLPLFSGAQHSFRSLDLFPNGEVRAAPEPSSELPGLPEISSIAVPVGFQSVNKTTVVGRQGYLFLYSGNNDLLAQYMAAPGSVEVVESASAWASLIENRARRMDEGRRFIQIIIPEKTSALSALFPRPLQTPTPVYKALVDRLSQKPDAALLDCFPFLSGNPNFFTKLDSHLSSRGCYEIFRHLLNALSLPPIGELTFGSVDMAVGDLGTHLVGSPVTEVLTDELSVMQGICDSAPVLEATVLAQGHVGTKCVWSNKSAPIDLKVVAFANSFFDTGETPRRLSWWCARWFTEFHFIWSASVDDEYISVVNPDIVIAQTIERFLARVPER